MSEKYYTVVLESMFPRNFNELRVEMEKAVGKLGLVIVEIKETKEAKTT